MDKKRERKVIIIFGPPGVGKGTQAKIISTKINYEHISMGEILREEVNGGSKLGIEIKRLIDNGEFVSGDIIMDIVRKHLVNSNYEGIIFDGIPRTVKQADMLLNLLKKYKISKLKVINIDAHEEELVNRLVKRAKIEKRKDDNIKTIKRRMEIYHKLTKPVIDFFKKNKVEVVDVNGVGSIKEISENISDLINEK